MSINKLLCALFLIALAPSAVTAGIISDSLIRVNVETASSNGQTVHLVTANGQYDETFVPADPLLDAYSWRHEALITTEGIHTRLTSSGVGTSGLRAGVVDFYTVSGGTPGESISFDARFRVTGNSQHIPVPNGPEVFGRSGVGFAVGLGLDSFGNVIGGNPAIGGIGLVNDNLDPVNNTTVFQNTDFDTEIVAPLTVTVGQQFQLSFLTAISHSNAVQTDMFNTATVSFDLPEGMTIASEKGFGTSSPTNNPVPEPSSLALLGIGAASLCSLGWRRRQLKMSPLS